MDTCNFTTGGALVGEAKQDSIETLINRHKSNIAAGKAALIAIQNLGYIHSGEEHWYYVIGDITYKLQRAEANLQKLLDEMT